MPYVHMGYDKYTALFNFLAPYHAHLLIPAVVGLVLVFFGGSFMTIIMCVEAYRMIGYRPNKVVYEELQSDYEIFLEIHAKENQVDSNVEDGVPDTNQVDPQQLAARKTLMFLKTVEPIRLSNFIGGFNAGILAAIATVKLPFAKAVTLGNALGDIAAIPSRIFLIPALATIIPSEYAKWAEPIMNYAVKTVCITLAWMSHRGISCIFSAIRGGTMCARNLLRYLSAMGYVEINPDETVLDELAGAVLALVGIWSQFSFGYDAPFPLNVIMSPFLILEFFLYCLLS